MSETRGRETPWREVQIGGRSFRQVDLGNEEIGARIIEEIEAGVEVYYNQRWDLTRRFCGYILDHPELVEGLRVLVAGAGVGLEAVVVGDLAAEVVVNDVAPVALELQMEQLAANGIRGARAVSGGFQDASLGGIDLVVASYVVYDDASRSAMTTLFERTARKGIPILLANEDLEGHFSRLLDATDRSVTELERDGGRYVVWIS